MTHDTHDMNDRDGFDGRHGTQGGADAGPDRAAPPRDELDRLLRDWHEASADAARARRDELLARAIGAGRGGGAATSELMRHPAAWRDRVHRIATAPGWRAAAVVAVAVIAGAIMLLTPSRSASADGGIVQVPEGGRLDAVDREGNLIGPCPLAHTDVDAQISGFVTRVTVTQKYRNSYPRTIEAVYTFPLSHRAAVDRMRLIVRSHGEERIVEGEVKERSLARQIYESARRDGFVTSLLEQERPNIFTQSVANIEPGAEVLVEISYVETLAMRDGVFTFDFPMVVGPRYIPGNSASPTSPGGMPAGLVARQGVVLLAPAQIRLAPPPVTILSGDQAPQSSPPPDPAARAAPITARAVLDALDRAVPVETPARFRQRGAMVPMEEVRAVFAARYPDGSEEPGTLLVDGTGEVAGRWFWCPPVPEPSRARGAGTGFAKGTDQVPDAGLITPMPVRPPERAGHDLSLRIAIDTGGPAVTNLRSELHRVDVSEPTPSRAVVTLEKGATLPNRDFVLSWKLSDGALAEGVLTQRVPGKDGYFLLYLVPPARVAAETIRARELVFVLDTSGSMRGFPIEKSKEVMTRMLGAMRKDDTFNVITFAGDHHVLWPAPRPATEENLKLAQAFVESRQGGGGTEMMKAIEAALKPTPTVIAEPPIPRSGEMGWIPSNTPNSPPVQIPVRLTVPPTRFVCFLTDGYVGNDMAIVDAVRRYAGSTRVFSFGIGNSVNRYLLAEMAAAGRGAADFVLLPSDADEVVARFSERVRTPVLTDISVSFDGVETAHVTPPTDAIPDLFDREPLVIAGRSPSGGRGTVTIRGMTGAGPWERTIPVDFSEGEGNSTVVASLWARRQVDDILRPHLTALQQGQVPPPVRDMVVRLAEQHRIMSPFTSFVAVEKTRVSFGGQPVLVAVPIELPQGVSWEGNFGCAGDVLKALRAPPQLMADDQGNEIRLYSFAAAHAAGLQFDNAPIQKLDGDIPVLSVDSFHFGAPPAPSGAGDPAVRSITVDALREQLGRTNAPAAAAPPPPPTAAAPSPAGSGAPTHSKSAPPPAPKAAEPPVTERAATTAPPAPPNPMPASAPAGGGSAAPARAPAAPASPPTEQAPPPGADKRLLADARSAGEKLGVDVHRGERRVEAKDADGRREHGVVSGGLGGGGGGTGAGSGGVSRDVAPADRSGLALGRRAGAAPAPSDGKPGTQHESNSAFPRSSIEGGTPVTGSDPGAAPPNRADAQDQGGAPADRPRSYSQEQLNLISRRLEASLFLAAFEALAAKDADAAAAATGAAAPAVEHAPAPGPGEPSASTDPGVRVLVRFAAIDDALEQALRAIGATIESRGSVRGTAVVRLPRHRLVDLALLDATIRVEPLPDPDAAPPASRSGAPSR